MLIKMKTRIYAAPAVKGLIVSSRFKLRKFDIVLSS